LLSLIGASWQTCDGNQCVKDCFKFFSGVYVNHRVGLSVKMSEIDLMAFALLLYALVNSLVQMLVMSAQVRWMKSIQKLITEVQVIQAQLVEGYSLLVGNPSNTFLSSSQAIPSANHFIKLQAQMQSITESTKSIDINKDLKAAMYDMEQNRKSQWLQIIIPIITFVLGKLWA
jgi:hypothetical protein